MGVGGGRERARGSLDLPAAMNEAWRLWRVEGTCMPYTAIGGRMGGPRAAQLCTASISLFNKEKQQG
eukprot:scaffold80905_cov19-Tisochrysis_lutea.AAC.2